MSPHTLSVALGEVLDELVRIFWTGLVYIHLVI